MRCLRTQSIKSLMNMARVVFDTAADTRNVRRRGMLMLRVELPVKSSSANELKITFVVRKHKTRRHTRWMRMSLERFEYGIL
jgi:hypothetical protein